MVRQGRDAGVQESIGALIPFMNVGRPQLLHLLAALGEPVGLRRGHGLELRIDAELLRRVHRPVRIVEKLARERDQVGAAFLQDLLGLVAMHDQPDRHAHDVGIAAQPLRVRAPDSRS